jgi:Cu/Ag efflux protein CusF
MKKIAITVAAVLTFALAGCGQPQEQSSTTAAPASTSSAPAASTGIYTTTGQVTAVAPDSVTISHQPVPALNWPAMTMTFKAPDQAMVAGLQNGSAVEFSFRQEGSDNVLTAIKPR